MYIPAHTISVMVLPSQEMNRYPAASVPAIEPMAPAANSPPSARPLRCGSASTSPAAISGEGMPAATEGAKKAHTVSAVMPVTAVSNRDRINGETRGNMAIAARVASAARTSTAARKARLRPPSRSVACPPIQCPSESPASTTAMTEVHV